MIHRYDFIAIVIQLYYCYYFLYHYYLLSISYIGEACSDARLTTFKNSFLFSFFKCETYHFKVPKLLKEARASKHGRLNTNIHTHISRSTSDKRDSFQASN